MAFHVAYEIQIARSEQAEDLTGELSTFLVLGTDRPIAIGEVMRDSWTKDNNVSIVTLTLDPETGEGTGTMIFGAEFGVDKKTGKISIESVASNPTDFTKVVTLEEKKNKKKD